MIVIVFLQHYQLNNFDFHVLMFLYDANSQCHLP